MISLGNGGGTVMSNVREAQRVAAVAAARSTYPGQALVEARSREWLSRQTRATVTTVPIPKQILPVTPIVMRQTPISPVMPIPAPSRTRPVMPVPYTPRPAPMPPVIVAGPGVPTKQEAPAPNPVTAPLLTTVGGIPQLDTIRNLLIVMVILQFLQMFGGVMAGAAGGFTAGMIRG